MLENLSSSVRRFTGAVRGGRTQTPLVRVGEGPDQAVAVAHSDIAMLRGVSGAAADTADCTCPESCERDHANE